MSVLSFEIGIHIYLTEATAIWDLCDDIWIHITTNIWREWKSTEPNAAKKYFQKCSLSKVSNTKESSTLRGGKRFSLALLNLGHPARGVKLDKSSGTRP